LLGIPPLGGYNYICQQQLGFLVHICVSILMNL